MIKKFKVKDSNDIITINDFAVSNKHKIVVEDSDGIRANAQSILGLMALNFQKEINIIFDDNLAVNKLIEILQKPETQK